MLRAPVVAPQFMLPWDILVALKKHNATEVMTASLSTLNITKFD